jgi:hypothetical protein
MGILSPARVEKSVEGARAMREGVTNKKTNGD